MKLNKNICDDINRKWIRNCPQCNKELIHVSERSYMYSFQKNNMCRSCSAINKIPSSIETRSKISESNISSENRKILLQFPYMEKSCPKCNKIIKYKNKCNLFKSVKNNTLCNSCIQKRDIANGKRKLWNNGKMMSEEFSKKIKASWERTKRFRCKENHPYFGKPGPMSGKSQSENTRYKQRMSHIEYLRTKTGNDKFSPNYNKHFCKYIDKFGKDNCLHIMHAENGGEFYFRGYFADGYIPSKNVWIEYDERNHYYGGILKYNDIIRQSEIEKYLGCKILRIKECVSYEEFKYNILNCL